MAKQRKRWRHELERLAAREARDAAALGKQVVALLQQHAALLTDTADKADLAKYADVAVGSEL